MSDEPSSPAMAPEGQAAAPETGQAVVAPEGATGQALAPHGQDAGQAAPPQPTDEPSFFDPTTLDPNLLPAYKMMQGRFTQGMQKIKTQEKKIKAYETFERAPQSPEMQQFLAQYGYVPASMVQQMQAQQQGQQQKDWEPQTWDELISKAREEGATLAEQRIMEKLQPILGQVHGMAAKTIEQQLSTIDPKWRDYEDNMKQTLSQYPQMVNDVAMLYRVSVPQEILEAKAIKEALDKFQTKAQHAQVATKSTAPRSSPAAAKVKSFDEAVAAAKRELGMT